VRLKYKNKNMVKRARSGAANRRRVRRRTSYRPRVSRGIRGSAVPRMSHFQYKAKRYQFNWAYSPASTAGFWRYLQFTAATLIPDYGERAVVFDEYKISAIVIELRPQFDGMDLLSGALGSYHIEADPSSTLSPSGIVGPPSLNTFFEQSQTCKTYKADQVSKTYFRPKVQSQILGGGLAGRSTYCPWLKTDSADVEFRGVHVYLQPHNFGPNVVSFDVYTTVYAQFRGNR